MNKLPSNVLKRSSNQSLRIGIWHIDGTSQVLPTSPTNHEQFQKQQFQHHSGLAPKMSFEERKPFISKFLSSMANSVDAFVVVGTGGSNNVKHPSEICDLENHYDCFGFQQEKDATLQINTGKKGKFLSASRVISSGSDNFSNGNIFLFVPKKLTRRNRCWVPEILPGAGGLHVKFVYTSSSSSPSIPDKKKIGNKKSGENDEEEELWSIKSDDDTTSTSNEEASSNTKSSSIISNKQSVFVNCCFLDLDGVSRSNTSGSRGHTREGITGSNSSPKILPMTHELGFSGQQQGFNVKQIVRERIMMNDDNNKNGVSSSTNIAATTETNETRLNDYFTNVSTATDIVAGHLRHFRIGNEALVNNNNHINGNKKNDDETTIPHDEEEQAKKIKARGVYNWRDAWILNGKKEDCRFTFDASLNMKKYYDAPSSSSTDDPALLVGTNKRSDRFLIRESSQIFCNDLKTIRSASVNNKTNNNTAEMLLASCYLPVVAEFHVPNRWVV